MSQTESQSLPRILIVDDNPAIHEDFKKILGGKSETRSRLDALEAGLFGDASALDERSGFRLDSANQGQEALAMIEKALKENDPYLLAFVDVRMPPGWDGIETLERVWKIAPDLQAVICTAYSDYSWDDMIRRFGHTDNLLILKKPFETVEVLQLTHALTKKWSLSRQAKFKMDDLDCMVRERTEQLVAANGKLQQEIEERSRIEDALRSSEERFSKAFHASPMPMALQSFATRQFLDANQSFLALANYAPDQMLQKTCAELQLWSDHSAEFAKLLGADTRLRNHSCPLRRSDGSIRQTLISTEPLYLGDVPAQLLLVHDVTEQLKLESQLRQSQKLEAIGRMSAGIAHEFNNLLTIIQGDVGILRNADPNFAGRNALLDQIMQASLRAAGFTKQLLAYSRKLVLQPKPLNLSGVVQNSREMLGRFISAKYQIRFNCAAELPQINADESGVEQILTNLCLNARDAMPEGGTLEISTGEVTLDSASASLIPEARAGHFVWLGVADRGCGMDTKVYARIFDPFFTTKEIGKGAGLGLSTIQGIVKQHDGWIQVLTKIGQGSTFKVFFPVQPRTAVAPQNGNEPKLQWNSTTSADPLTVKIQLAPAASALS
jgi:two-component system cell cycle sensor histidine kinase/response regulator CckA